MKKKRREANTLDCCEISFVSNQNFHHLQLSIFTSVVEACSSFLKEDVRKEKEGKREKEKGKRKRKKEKGKRKKEKGKKENKNKKKEKGNEKEEKKLVANLISTRKKLRRSRKKGLDCL